MIRVAHVWPAPPDRGAGLGDAALRAATADRITWHVIPRTDPITRESLADADVAYAWNYTAVRRVRAACPQLPIVWRWCLGPNAQDYAAIDQCDRLIVTSARLRESVSAKLRARVQVIAHAPRGSRWCPSDRPKQKIPALLYVGAMTPMKGVPDLIAACPPGAQLWLAGEPALPREHAFGWVADPLGLYQDATLFVFPSRHREAAPNVLLEAMACGLPCLAYDTPDNRDTLQNAGAYCQRSQLRNAIDDLLADPGRRTAMSARGLAIAATRPWQGWVDAMASAMLDACRTSSPSVTP